MAHSSELDPLALEETWLKCKLREGMGREFEITIHSVHYVQRQAGHHVYRCTLNVTTKI